MMNCCVYLEVGHWVQDLCCEWKLMADQDPCADSVAGDSGHGTMTVKTELNTDNEELVRAVGRTNKNPSTQHCSDVKWNDKDLLIEISDENITVH